MSEYQILTKGGLKRVTANSAAVALNGITDAVKFMASANATDLRAYVPATGANKNSILVDCNSKTGSVIKESATGATPAALFSAIKAKVKNYPSEPISYLTKTIASSAFAYNSMPSSTAYTSANQLELPAGYNANTDDKYIKVKVLANGVEKQISIGDIVLVLQDVNVESSGYLYERYDQDEENIEQLSGTELKFKLTHNDYGWTNNTKLYVFYNNIWTSGDDDPTEYEVRYEWCDE